MTLPCWGWNEMELNLVQKITIFALPVVFAITLHEAAHGYAALDRKSVV